MTKLDNVSQTAKDFCREALTEARELQARLGVSRDEQCKLPVTFNRLRSVERFEALTTEYDAVATECREKLVAKTVEKPKMSALEQLVYDSKHSAARKRCDKALLNAQKLQRSAGLAVTPSRSFKSASLEELGRLENEYAEAAKIAIALTPKPEPKPVVTITKIVATVAKPELPREESVSEPTPPVVEAKAEEKAPQPEYGEARRQAAKEYKELLVRLVRLEGNFERYGYRKHELYREQPLALTKRELRALTAEINERIAAIPPKVPAYKREVTHKPFKGWGQRHGVAA